MPNFVPNFNPLRFRSYIVRLPLFTRLCLLIIAVFWVLELQTIWDIVKWGALVPSEMRLSNLYRFNTYPFIHLGIFHALFNCLALIPLLERFEAEHGTLLSFLLFTGPLSILPGVLYIFVEKGILWNDNAVVGASVWVFLLLAAEAIKTWRTNPYFSLGDSKIPTWITPLLLVFVVSILIPGVSFVGHVCAVAIGYAFGLNYLRILQPPDGIIRSIELKLNLLGRLPHYVSVDQKTCGRYGILPTREPHVMTALGSHSGSERGYVGGTQRLGP